MLKSDPIMSYSGKFTIGGYDADQAYTWTAESCQKLGNFIYQMMCGRRDNQLRGHLDISEMRRHFMRDIWDQYIYKLDEYRKSLGMCTISEYFDNVTKLWHDGKVVMPAEDPEPCQIIPEIAKKEPEFVKKEPVFVKNFSGEQLSLF